ncbi:MAG: ATP-binding cassette domain-containing protein [Acidimicrobiales bacterium]
MPEAVEAHGLEKIFKGGVRALDGVGFTVRAGSVFGLLGPNGAGKTTVVRILTTVLRPDAGSASVLGVDVASHPAAVRRLIGLAGQNAAVDENLTAKENLSMVGRLNHMSRGDTGSRTSELLEQFQLAHAANRPLKTYSGGMRRRVDLAAALMARPPVLFLDEPTTGLDPQSRNDLWEVIEGLVGGGTTVLLTTQYLEEADRLAEQVAVVDHGRVIAEGSPTELKARLGSTVLDIVLEDVPTAERAAALLDPSGTAGLAGARPSRTGARIELPVQGGPRVAMEVLRHMDAAGIVPSGFTLREPSLDDVFLILTGHVAQSPPGTAGEGAMAPVEAAGESR